MSNARNLANLLGTKTKVKDVDVDGTELILDSDGDSSITADTDDQIDFKTGGSDRVTIDSSGNLLVAKTSNDSGTAVGAILGNAGVSRFTADGAHPVVIKRKSDDGDIIQLEKDSTIVGGIGTNSSILYVGSPEGTDAFLGFGNQIIRPVTSAGASRDNAIDLGYDGMRFRNLYLSGGAYIGGTGSANYLDDYEEGTWVPVFQNDGSTNYAVQLGKYRKIGDVVIATYHIDILSSNGIGSNALVIENLPFTVANSSAQYGNASSLHCSSWSTTTKPDNALATNNTTQLSFFRSDGQTGAVQPTGNDIGNGNILGHVIFFVS